MQRNTSITLGNHFEQFIDYQVKNGRYNSTSEVIIAGLRLLEERENKVAALRSALIAGEKSGFADYSFQDIISDLDKER
jgi:antitoxin ParD1/3/4